MQLADVDPLSQGDHLPFWVADQRDRQQHCDHKGQTRRRTGDPTDESFRRRMPSCSPEPCSECPPKNHIDQQADDREKDDPGHQGKELLAH